MYLTKTTNFLFVFEIVDDDGTDGFSSSSTEKRDENEDLRGDSQPSEGQCTVYTFIYTAMSYRLVEGVNVRQPNVCMCMCLANP